MSIHLERALNQIARMRRGAPLERLRDPATLPHLPPAPPEIDELLARLAAPTKT